MKHAHGSHHHPRLWIALRTRTRLLGTLNMALALRGGSCGWGTCERPRRTFVGHHRINPGGGFHFIEFVLHRGNDDRVWPLIRHRPVSGGSDRG